MPSPYSPPGVVLVHASNGVLPLLWTPVIDYLPGHYDDVVHSMPVQANLFHAVYTYLTTLSRGAFRLLGLAGMTRWLHGLATIPRKSG